jgi:hypothetical protein
VRKLLRKIIGLCAQTTDDRQLGSYGSAFRLSSDLPA